MEFIPIAESKRTGLSSSCYLEFVLDRVVHDLGNAISGIDSLSRYHLKAGVSDPDLEESLKLIHESAGTSRELLIKVGSLLHPLEGGEEVVRASELIGDTVDLLSTLLPKSIRITSQVSVSDFDRITVSRNSFMRRIVALTAYNLGNARVPSGNIELDCGTENGLTVVTYRSTVHPLLLIDEDIFTFFIGIGPDIEINGSTQADYSLLTICFQTAGSVQDATKAIN